MVTVCHESPASVCRKGTPMDMTVKMGNRFCFIRNDNGKLLSVFHSPNDTTDIVNLKKTIASAFQANFDKTATTVKEVDSLSAHTSHYRSVYDQSCVY